MMFHQNIDTLIKFLFSVILSLLEFRLTNIEVQKQNYFVQSFLKE